MTSRFQRFVPIAEIASAVAVVVSLVFVGLEIRNSAEQSYLNTQALEISAYQSLMESISQMNVLAIENPQQVALTRKGFSNPNELTDVEAGQFENYLFMRFRHGDMAYFLFERGAIDEARLNSAICPLADNLRKPAAQEFWAKYKSNFVKPFQNYIDRLLEFDDSSCI